MVVAGLRHWLRQWLPQRWDPWVEVPLEEFHEHEECHQYEIIPISRLVRSKLGRDILETLAWDDLTGVRLKADQVIEARETEDSPITADDAADIEARAAIATMMAARCLEPDAQSDALKFEHDLLHQALAHSSWPTTRSSPRS